MNIAPDRVGGEVDVDVAEPRAVGASWLVRFLRRYLSLALVGLLLLWLVPVLYDRAARALERGPLASLGRGALTLVGMPLALLVALGLVILLAVILGLLTLGGLAGSVVVLGAAFLFLVGALFVLALVYLAYVVVAYAGGRWLLGRGGGSLSDNAILAFLIGLLIVVLLSFIPVVGWLVTLAVILLGLGALWQIWRARPRPPRVAPAAPA